MQRATRSWLWGERDQRHLRRSGDAATTAGEQVDPLRSPARSCFIHLASAEHSGPLFGLGAVRRATQPRAHCPAWSIQRTELAMNKSWPVRRWSTTVGRPSGRMVLVRYRVGRLRQHMGPHCLTGYSHREVCCLPHRLGVARFIWPHSSVLSCIQRSKGGSSTRAAGLARGSGLTCQSRRRRKHRCAYVSMQATAGRMLTPSTSWLHSTMCAGGRTL